MNPFEMLMGHKGSKSHEWQCTDCGRYFPRSCLVWLHSKFEEVEGKYCDRCIHKAMRRDKQLLDECMNMEIPCDGCGTPYPRSHLCYQATPIYSGFFCSKCEVEDD